jgi:hypothetical protein
MNSIKFLFRKFAYPFYPLGLLVEALTFKLGRTKFQSKYLISTFLLLGGRPGTVLSQFLGSKQVNFERLGSASSIDLGNSYSLFKLTKDGYTLFPSALNQACVDKILDLSFSLKGANRVMDSGNGYQDGIYFDRANPKTVRFDYHPNDLISDVTIQKLVSDPTILKIAQDYLGTLPVLDFVVMWWHTKSKSPDKEAAQFFHFDMDRLRWVKFFFYITDVGPENGPHIFVPTSHSDNGLPFGLRKNGYKRLEDNQVKIHFKQESWQQFIGPQGSMIVEDTRGLHKGKHVENGDRLVFQIQFTTSLFGTDITNLELSENTLGDELRTAITEFPEIYRNIIITK